MRYKDGTKVIIINAEYNYSTWRDKMIELGFPTYITDNVYSFINDYLRGINIKEYVYVVKSGFRNNGASIYHIESIPPFIIKSDRPCHLLMQENGITEWRNT